MRDTKSLQTFTWTVCSNFASLGAILHHMVLETMWNHHRSLNVTYVYNTEKWNTQDFNTIILLLYIILYIVILLHRSAFLLLMLLLLLLLTFSCTILSLCIKSEIMDGFWSSRCLNDPIDLPDKMRAFLSSTLPPWWWKVELKKLFRVREGCKLKYLEICNLV